MDYKEIKSVKIKEIKPEYSWEGLMLKLKLQYFGHLMGRANSLEQTLMLEKIEGRRRRGRQRLRWFDGPLLLLPSIFPSIRVFSNESTLLILWPKYWSFSFSISLSNEYSELISFKIDWFDLLAVQGTLKSLLQHHSSKASVFSTQPSLWSSSHIRTRLLENHSFDSIDLCWQSDVSAFYYTL